MRKLHLSWFKWVDLIRELNGESKNLFPRGTLSIRKSRDDFEAGIEHQDVQQRVITAFERKLSERLKETTGKSIHVNLEMPFPEDIRDWLLAEVSPQPLITESFPRTTSDHDYETWLSPVSMDQLARRLLGKNADTNLFTT